MFDWLFGKGDDQSSNDQTSSGKHGDPLQDPNKDPLQDVNRDPLSDSADPVLSTLAKESTDSELKAFLGQTHEVKAFNSSTGLGLFDVSYNPVSQRMEALFRIKFNFIDANALEYPGAAETDIQWQDGEAAKWRSDFITLVEGRWGGKFRFACDKEGFESVRAYVDVEVEDSDEDWHYECTIKKIPPGEFEQSFVTTYLDSNELEQNTGTFDSEDLKWRQIAGASEAQKPAVHEFGHLIGLDDEYDDGTTDVRHGTLVQDALGTEVVKADTDDVMSQGNQIRPQHYVTFLEALKEASGIQEWSFES